MVSTEELIASNKECWDAVASRFFGRTALPTYGPFASTEEQLHLFGDVTGYSPEHLAVLWQNANNKTTNDTARNPHATLM